MYLVGVCCVLNVKYMVSDHVLWHSYPTTDSNTSTGMIWVTLNMPSAANRQGIWLESGHPVKIGWYSYIYSKPHKWHFAILLQNLVIIAWIGVWKRFHHTSAHQPLVVDSLQLGWKTISSHFPTDTSENFCWRAFYFTLQLKFLHTFSVLRCRAIKRDQLTKGEVTACVHVKTCWIWFVIAIIRPVWQVQKMHLYRTWCSEKPVKAVCCKIMR